MPIDKKTMLIAVTGNDQYNKNGKLVGSSFLKILYCSFLLTIAQRHILTIGGNGLRVCAVAD